MDSVRTPWLSFALTLAAGALGCGATTGTEAPPRCASAADCPPVDDFCSASARCEGGFCALGPPPDCDDDDVCTVEACDGALESCVRPLRDRDADGFEDGSCGGPDCDDHRAEVHPGARERCEGGRDEDCDGRFDCSDPECTGDPSCVGCSPERCEGGLDEDCDGTLDCADADCTCCVPVERACDDARDDDCDGDVDCLDEDCGLALSCCEPRLETCNGLDEDCDGIVDDGATCFFLDGEPIEPVATAGCGGGWYAYDSPDPASAHPAPDVRLSDEVAVAVVAQPASCGGAAIAVIADLVRDGTGGSLALSFTLDRPGIGGILVSDDPRECTFDPRTGSGRCVWSWEPCCTDGVLIGPLGPEFCVRLAFDAASGVSRALAYHGPRGAASREFGEPIEICARTSPAR